jgi:tetratricopeptide (TPR) repeat protein
MYTEDFILRQIRLALSVIAHIQRFKQAGQYEQAQQSIDQALETLMGLRANLLKHLGDDKLINMLTLHDSLDVERLAILADLFQEESEVLTLQGRQDDAQAPLQRALRFYLEVALDDPGRMPEDILRKIEALRPKLEIDSLPLETQMALLDYLERLQRWSDGDLAEVGCERSTLETDAAALSLQLKDYLNPVE